MMSPSASRGLSMSTSTIVEQQTDRWYVLLLPVVVGSLVLGTLVFRILRALGGRHVLYCGFSTVMISVCAMFVGLLLLIAEGYGLHACSEALVGDYIVLISIPLGVGVAIGALLGWRIAELP